MRNQQIKKVNRVFFSGQDDDKRKWIEGMAAEGWQLTSESAFVYSFQKINSESQEIQPSYRSILGLDLQKSMPIFQEIRQEWPTLLSKRQPESTQYPLAVITKTEQNKQTRDNVFGRSFLGWMVFSLFLVLAFTKIGLVSSGDLSLLFRWQLFSTFLLAILFITIGVSLVLKSIIKLIGSECKTKK